MFDLSFIWAGLIAFAVLAYVLFDGFDLGVALLFPFARDENHRDDMMNSVAPVWDGNETWLVLGGGGLFAVFPLAYAIVMPALYPLIITMLLGLVFRGVAFEFRFRARSKRLWDLSFFGGSLVAALAQGLALGALTQGVKVSGRAYAGGWFDWLTPFSILCALALIVGYMLLGACWLILKTEGALQARAFALARLFGPATIAAIALVSLWTPFISDIYFQRWLGWPQILLVAPMPLLVAGCSYLLLAGLRDRRELQPFLAAEGLFILCFIGLGVGFYPYIVPHSVTIKEAAAPDASLAFLLSGASVLIPIILAYTAYAYWVFRGKVRGGYH